MLAKAVSLPAMGAIAHRFGARRLLGWGGMAIIPLSCFWIISGNFYYLFCVQIVGGVAWAAYELAMFLLFFETMPAEERTSLLTRPTIFAHSATTAAGSLLGSGFAAPLGPDPAHLFQRCLPSRPSAGLFACWCSAALRQSRPSSLATPVSTRTLELSAARRELAWDQPILAQHGDRKRSGLRMALKRLVAWKTAVV